jgi:hypothetical protein
MRFVLLDAVAEPETVVVTDEGLLRAAYEELTA